MDDGMSDSDPRDPAMEAIKSREGPVCEPEEGIISGGKDPDHGELREGEETGAVGDVAEPLEGLGRVVLVIGEDVVAGKVHCDVDEEVEEEDERFDSGWDGAEFGDGVTDVIREGRWEQDVHPQPSPGL